jgi:hypothetical protein
MARRRGQPCRAAPFGHVHGKAPALVIPEGSSDAVAAANLLSRITELTTSAGMTIGRTKACRLKCTGIIAALVCAIRSAVHTILW